MALAILCRRRHKVAILAKPNQKFGLRFLDEKNVCGMERKNERHHERIYRRGRSRPAAYL